jgi:hypothetical protein
MITAIVTEKGQSIPTIIQQEIGQMSEEHAKILAEEHKKELDKAIDDTRERSLKPVGNHLKDQIQVEKIYEGQSVGYGVGNIETLNQKAPWWAWINFGRAGTGRTAPPTDMGSFTGTPIPVQAAFRQGLWQHGFRLFVDKIYYMAPNRDIQAHNYIEKALGIMVQKARELLKF